MGRPGILRTRRNARSRYSDISPDDWERELKGVGSPEHVTRHLLTMGELHRAGRYDRLAGRRAEVTVGQRRASENCITSCGRISASSIIRSARSNEMLRPTGATRGFRV